MSVQYDHLVVLHSVSRLFDIKHCNYANVIFGLYSVYHVVCTLRVSNGKLRELDKLLFVETESGRRIGLGMLDDLTLKLDFKKVTLLIY